MPYLTDKACIVHIPKTGGSTIHNLLARMGLLRGLLAGVHDPAPNDLLPTFAAIRHPVDYLRSVWLYGAVRVAENHIVTPLPECFPDDLKRLYWSAESDDWPIFLRLATELIPGCCGRIFDHYLQHVTHTGRTSTLVRDLVRFLRVTGHKCVHRRIYDFVRCKESRPWEMPEIDRRRILNSERYALDKWGFT